MATIRASEIGSFIYCRRAWWYRREGYASQNQAEMNAGSAFHAKHGRQVVAAGLLRLLAGLLLLAALAALVVALVNALLG